MSAPEPVAPALPRHFMRPCLLLLLREQPAHGYELLQRLRTFGFVRDDPGRLYRLLRALEDEGLVHSAWERTGSGPDRRIYQLTRSGVEELHRAASALASVSDVLTAFLSRYSEFVEIRPRRERARAGR
jgi:PadR family transcriptional regulator, regulatory protein PadR